MVVVLTNSADATADFLIAGSTGEYLRLDTDRLESHTVLKWTSTQGTLEVAGASIDVQEVTGVWVRRPEPIKLAEAPDDRGRGAFLSNEWAAAVEGVLRVVPPARWVNTAGSNLRAGNKPAQLRTAGTCGLMVPETIVTNSNTDIQELARSGGPLIIKPLNEGALLNDDGGVELFYTSELRADALTDDEVRECPVLVQRRVQPKMDVRVTVVDANAHAVSIRSNSAYLDVRKELPRNALYELIETPPPVAEALQRYMSAYQLRFCAFDFAVDEDGAWWFLEGNANGQWAWLDLQAGTRVADDLRAALELTR